MVKCKEMKMKYGTWNSGKGSALVPCYISSCNQAF
jgi:hypothetical protein